VWGNLWHSQGATRKGSSIEGLHNCSGVRSAEVLAQSRHPRCTAPRFLASTQLHLPASARPPFTFTAGGALWLGLFRSSLQLNDSMFRWSLECSERPLTRALRGTCDSPRMCGRYRLSRRKQILEEAAVRLCRRPSPPNCTYSMDTRFDSMTIQTIQRLEIIEELTLPKPA